MKIKILSGILVLFSLLLLSCGSSENDDPAASGDNLILSVDHNIIANDGKDEAHFTVKDGSKEVTYACVIEETSTGEKVEGGVFSSIKNGEYTFVAKWGGKVSNEVKVTVEGEITFVRNALIVEATSVDCIFCPGMHKIIKDKLMPKYPGRVYAVALHSLLLGPEPMAIREYDEPWRSRFAIYGLPTSVIDYYQIYKANSPEALLDNIITQPALVGIGIITRLEGQKLTLELKAKAVQDIENPCKLVVLLTEDGIIAPQMGDGGGPNYEHNWVLRKYLTSLFGDQLAEGEIARNREYTKTINYTIDAAFNSQNMHAIVGIMDAKSGKLMNCQRVKLGESVDYQYKN